MMEVIPNWVDDKVKTYTENYDRITHANVIPYNYGIGLKFVTNGVEYLTFNRQTPREINVKITSWIGISGDAIHKYATIYVHAPELEYEENGVKTHASIGGAFQRPKETDDIEINVKRYLTSFEKNNDPDRWESHRIGSLISGFEDEDQLYKYTIDLLKTRFTGKWRVNIEGFSKKTYNRVCSLKKIIKENESKDDINDR